VNPAPLREATAADLPALVAAQAACFPGDPWSPAQVAEELGRPGGVFLVQPEDDGLAGFVIGWAVLDELHLLQVGVLPAARGRGLGRRLVEGLLAAVRSEVCWLEVRHDNGAALALYAALGFRPVNVRKRYYPDGADAVILRLGLSDRA
jgi:ribosomal-protein-alanine acetyltransferase